MTKKTVSFLLKVNYRLRSEMYQLRRLSQAVLDAAAEGKSMGRAHDDIQALSDFLRNQDQCDMRTWNALIKAELEEVNVQSK